jgi:hypothetical protein
MVALTTPKGHMGTTGRARQWRAHGISRLDHAAAGLLHIPLPIRLALDAALGFRLAQRGLGDADAAGQFPGGRGQFRHWRSPPAARSGPAKGSLMI